MTIDHVDATPVARQDQGMEHAPTGHGISQADADRMWKVSRMLANTALVAKPLQGRPEVVMGVGLHLAALGIPFSLVGLKQVHVWEDRGTVQMQLHYQAHIALMARAGHDAWIAEMDDDHATVCVKRGDNGREQSFTYTMAMAKRAGLLNKDNWQKHPHYMLPARAAVMATRFACPDALIGLDPEGGTATIQPVTPAQLPAPTSPQARDEAGEARSDPAPVAPSADGFGDLPPEAEGADEPVSTEEDFDHRRRHANAAMSGVGIKSDDARHDWVRECTSGRTQSTARLSQEDCDAVVIACERLATEEEAAAGGDPGPVEP